MDKLLVIFHMSFHTLKFILDRGAKISAVLTSTYYRRPPLVQDGMEILCKVKVEMFPTLKNDQLMDRLMELVKTLYNEPGLLIILESFLADELDADIFSNETSQKLPKN